jgi:N-methylhydantoinase A
VCFDAGTGYVETPVLSRDRLPPDSTVDGPAVIEEFGSTVPLHPGFTATVDDFGNLLVRRRA